MDKEVSILILTHNAPKYVRETIETLNEVTCPEDRRIMEIIVWDNASESETIDILHELKNRNYIDTLHLSDENLLFAGGNNACAKLASKETGLYLLLNSDVRIVDPHWYRVLKNAKVNGNYVVASYGTCDNPTRVDGYCYLIDRDFYDNEPLDENFQWFYGITKQQAIALKNSQNILGFYAHEHLLIHYGGKSGIDFKNAKGLDISQAEILKWYESKQGGEVIIKIAPGKNIYIYKFKQILKKIRNKIARHCKK